MTTDALRTRTLDACTRMRGKLWPNGLGFDRRRWEYSYSEVYQCWQAVIRPSHWAGMTSLGRGETPEAARAAAKRVTDGA